MRHSGDRYRCSLARCAPRTVVPAAHLAPRWCSAHPPPCAAVVFSVHPPLPLLAPQWCPLLARHLAPRWCPLLLGRCPPRATVVIAAPRPLPVLAPRGAAAHPPRCAAVVFSAHTPAALLAPQWCSLLTRPLPSLRHSGARCSPATLCHDGARCSPARCPSLRHCDTRWTGC